MAGINKVILIGNLGRDPELRYTKNNDPVASLSVATTRNVKKDEEWIEETEWHRVTVWGQQAEYVNKYAPKGRQVYVEGRLHTRKYEDKDGTTKYSTDIIAETVQLLGPRVESGGDAPAQEQRGKQQNSGGGQQRQQGGGRQQTNARSGGGGGSKSGGKRPADDGGHESYIPDPADDDIPF